MFWNRLIQYDILSPPKGFEDDSLLDHQFGITDIVIVPREYGREPSKDEYASGVDRVLALVSAHHPQVLVFVYKAVLDQILEIRFHSKTKSTYGFNPELDKHFGSRVFVFPLPGTPCTSEQAHQAMLGLRAALTAEPTAASFCRAGGRARHESW
jgi:hypothetical protein